MFAAAADGKSKCGSLSRKLIAAISCAKSSRTCAADRLRFWRRDHRQRRMPISVVTLVELLAKPQSRIVRRSGIDCGGGISWHRRSADHSRWLAWGGRETAAARTDPRRLSLHQSIADKPRAPTCLRSIFRPVSTAIRENRSRLRNRGFYRHDWIRKARTGGRRRAELRGQARGCAVE